MFITVNCVKKKFRSSWHVCALTSDYVLDTLKFRHSSLEQHSELTWYKARIIMCNFHSPPRSPSSKGKITTNSSFLDFYIPLGVVVEGVGTRHTQSQHKAKETLNAHILEIKERAICVKKNNVLVPKGRTRLRDPIHASKVVRPRNWIEPRTTNSNAYRIVLRLTNSLFEKFLNWTQ